MIITFRMRTDVFQFIGRKKVFNSKSQKKINPCLQNGKTVENIYPRKLIVIVIIHQSKKSKLFQCFAE